ncbi:hypothetical protein RJ55_06436 [Drechmeria coniospora]|nr:hypothetical protein RJ55_06436 [Drechmeria coniospora]
MTAKTGCMVVLASLASMAMPLQQMEGPTGQLLPRLQVHVGHCPGASFCVDKICTTNVVNLDPLHCGPAGQACKTGEICVVGSCLPLNISSPATAAGGVEDCRTGQWRDGKGDCQPLRIALDARRCGPQERVCDPGQLCVNDVCVTIDIGADPKSCGESEFACEPGNWCFNGTCTPFELGTKSTKCRCDDDCPLGFPCGDGLCRQISVTTDLNSCGPNGTRCQPGELCLSGACRPVNITEEDALHRDSAACRVGEAKLLDRCSPIYIGLDPSRCGDHAECDGAEVCISGACVRDVHHPGTNVVHCGHDACSCAVVKIVTVTVVGGQDPADKSTSDAGSAGAASSRGTDGKTAKSAQNTALDTETANPDNATQNTSKTERLYTEETDIKSATPKSSSINPNAIQHDGK